MFHHNREGELSLLEKEMHKYKKETLRKISIFVHHECIEEFVRVFLFAYREGLISSINLADTMDLTQIEIESLNDNLKEFEFSYRKEQEHLIGMEQYEQKIDY